MGAAVSAINVDVGFRIDLERASNELTGEQIRALMSGIASVVAASGTPDAPPAEFIAGDGCTAPVPRAARLDELDDEPLSEPPAESELSASWGERRGRR